jgi:hypothetical protein
MAAAETPATGTPAPPDGSSFANAGGELSPTDNVKTNNIRKCLRWVSRLFIIIYPARSFNNSINISILIEFATDWKRV